jgi:hypothetical protein
MECNNCKTSYSVSIQFKFGDTWQHEYKLGDYVQWGGNDIGKPNSRLVKVYGIAETNSCPKCGEKFDEEFDIIVENDKLTVLNHLVDINDYKSDLDGNYEILIEKDL